MKEKNCSMKEKDSLVEMKYLICYDKETRYSKIKRSLKEADHEEVRFFFWFIENCQSEDLKKIF